jgi:squalene-associated FAD-dependent desaturase
MRRLCNPVFGGIANRRTLSILSTRMNDGNEFDIGGSGMQIIIAGGGLAGLAAAVALTRRGVSCLILESRPRLGGRASSFLDPASGTSIDNCQHVSLGCCTNFRHFCETTGLAEFFRHEKTLYFVGPTGTINRFSSSHLPAPLHLTRAFAGLSYLSCRDKLALAHGLRSLARGPTADERGLPFSEWLMRHGQTRTAIDRFWHVVLVSALSESLDRIDVEHARKVFVDTFLAHRDGWTVEIPTVPLDDLYGGRLTEWLTSRGSTIRLQASVERMELDRDRVIGVRLNSGEIVTGDEYIVALPFFRVLSVLPPSLAAHPDLFGISKLEAAPISSVHLWFDRPITELPHAVFVEGLCQWVFNRTAIAGGAADSDTRSDSAAIPGGNYYQIVISASRELAGQSRDAILAQVIAELTKVWPETAKATLLHSRQVTEHRAVFSPVPGVDALRPFQQSPIGNLQLAGDWTRTDWPATMEGAVRSGYLAAANILNRIGRSDEVLQPDLPVSRLSRWLMGIRR